MADPRHALKKKKTRHIGRMVARGQIRGIGGHKEHQDEMALGLKLKTGDIGHL